MSTVFSGTEPPAHRAFDWVVEPRAQVALDGQAAVPDIAVVKGLLDEAVPAVEAFAQHPHGALMRDEFFQLVLTVARAEAVARTAGLDEPVTVVARRHLPRPSRPPGVAAGLADRLDGRLEWAGPWRPQSFPAGAVGIGRAWRWTRSASAAGPIVAAIGGPSERRALEPVCAHLPEAVLVDYGIDVDPSLPSFGGALRLRDALGAIGTRSFLDHASSAWSETEWWGASWAARVRPSLATMARITLREAVLYERAAQRVLDGADAVVLAKVRFARSRAIAAAAQGLGVPVVAMQHGMYVDGNEWTDLRADVFAVSGEAFAGVLRRRGFSGEIRMAGAPFYTVPDRSWDCGIALQPPEGIVITSRDDYERHARAAHGAARSVLGPDATIGFRLHPREDEATLRRIIGDDVPTSRDPNTGGALWISIESSFVVQAVLSGAPTVLMNLNGHPWEYPFAGMPGLRVAGDEVGLEASLRDVLETGADGSAVADWRREFAVATGDDAARAIAGIVAEVAG